MKVTLALLAATAGSTFALPAANADAEAEASPKTAQRDGPSLTTYAISGFQVSSVAATIKSWSLFPIQGESVSFSAVPLGPSMQSLSSPISCSKTWTDSLFRGSTASTPVPCSDSKMSIYTSRNWLRFWEVNVYVDYKLPQSGNGTTNGTSVVNDYSAKFALNEQSTSLKCTRDRSFNQNCVPSGSGLLTSTLSEKTVSYRAR